MQLKFQITWSPSDFVRNYVQQIIKIKTANGLILLSCNGYCKQNCIQIQWILQNIVTIRDFISTKQHENDFVQKWSNDFSPFFFLGKCLGWLKCQGGHPNSPFMKDQWMLLFIKRSWRGTWYPSSTLLTLMAIDFGKTTVQCILLAQPKPSMKDIGLTGSKHQRSHR